MPLFYHKYVNYVLAHSVNYVITLYKRLLHRKKSDGEIYDSVKRVSLPQKRNVYTINTLTASLQPTFRRIPTHTHLSQRLKKHTRRRFDSEVHGISIGTRADCLSDDVIALLCDINSKIHLTVELGLQTVHDKTAQIINRCYSYDEFLEGYRKLQESGIRTCLHLIDGLPGETKADMLENRKGGRPSAPCRREDTPSSYKSRHRS